MAETETLDRVRAHTSDRILEHIDRKTEERVREYARATEETLSERIRELEREWDMERMLEANAATLALVGTLLGRFVDRRWWYLPGVVSAFLLQHALQGWCPPVEVFRRMDVRTRREIDTEKFALKLLRGDFDAALAEEEPMARAQKALQAARAEMPRASESR